MRRSCLFLSEAVFCVVTAFAQPRMEWIREVTMAKGEEIVAVQTLNAGSYLLITDRTEAARTSPRPYTVCIADSAFQIVRRHTYSLAGRPLDPLLMPDGRVALATTLYEVLMLSPTGDSLWTSPKLEEHFTGPCRAVLTLDASVVIGGSGKQKGLRLVKLSSGGKQLWQREFGMKTESQPLLGLASAPDGGVFAYGSFGPGTGECVIMHVSAAGDSLSSISPPPSTSCDGLDVFWSLPESGFLIGSEGNAGAGLTRIVRIGADGTKLWEQVYPPSSGHQQNFWATAVIGGRCILAGDTGITDTTGRGLRLSAINMAGQPLWKTAVSVPHLSIPFDILPAPDGGIVVAATSYNPDAQDVWTTLFIKFSAESGIHTK